MTDSLATKPSDRKKSDTDKEYLDLQWPEYKWPLIFMLCMSALGLKFPLAFLLLPIILFNRFRNDRYDFVIMFTMFCGEYGLISKNTMGFHPYFIGLIVAVVGIFAFRKSLLVKKILLLCGLYFAGICVFAMLSEERIMIQLGTMLRYMSVIYFLIPLMCFSQERFDIKIFFRKIMPYCLIMCVFYVLDCFVVNGWIFVPCTPLPAWADQSLFYSPVITQFGSFPRKYPQGLIFLTLAIYPLVKYYKLTKGQWLLIILALITTRTFTVMTGMLATGIFCQGNPRRFAKYVIWGIVVVAGLYFVDSKLPLVGELRQSTLRVKSSIDQFMIIQTMEDEEDLARLGSGRMAQVIPKMDLLYELNRQWIGFGFLHPEKTTMTKYIIDNPLYLEDVESEEVAALVEVDVIQHILFMGYFGLLMVICFYGAIMRLIRNLRYREYVYSVLFCVVWFGIGGFGGVSDAYTILLIGFTLGIILLVNRTSESKEENQMQLQ